MIAVRPLALCLVMLVVPFTSGCDAVAQPSGGAIARCTCYASRDSGDNRVLDRIFELDRCADVEDDDGRTVAATLSAECLAELEENNTISDGQACDCECFLTDDGCVVADR